MSLLLLPERLFTHISTGVNNQVLIYTTEWTGVSGWERKYTSFEIAAKGILTWDLSIESPAFYCWANALQKDGNMHLRLDN